MTYTYYFNTKEEADNFVEEASKVGADLTDADIKAMFPDIKEEREHEKYAVDVTFTDDGPEIGITKIFSLNDHKDAIKKGFLCLAGSLALGYILGKSNTRYRRLTKKEKKGLIAKIPGDILSDDELKAVMLQMSSINEMFCKNSLVVCKDTKRRGYSRFFVDHN